MNHMNLLKNVSPEVRAYIYQQLADLEQMLPEGSAISILIDDRNAKKVETAIKIETPFGEINALEKNGTVYESLSMAKDNLVRQLGEIHRAASEQQLDDGEEAPQVRASIGKHTLH